MARPPGASRALGTEGPRSYTPPTENPFMSTRDARDLSRRRFLQTASGALAAAPLASGAFAPAALEAGQVPNLKLPEAPGRKLGWALVGLGSLSINQIMPAFAKCTQSKLVGFVSGRPEKARHM